MSKLIIETGNVYGALKVLGPISINNHTLWHCQCECGNTKDVRGSDLRGHKVTSCGCHINRGREQTHDLTGQRFGSLVVQSLVPSYKKPIQDSHSYWYCLCDCGNTTIVSTSNLTTKNTTSCDCQQYKITGEKSVVKIPAGTQYGDFTVLGQGFNEKTNSWEQYCRCSCGKEKFVRTTDLKSGHIKSCGHLTFNSYCVTKIKEFFDNNNIQYIQEYSFEDLKSSREVKLRFDFAVFKNDCLLFLIEYNGKQHYVPVDYWGGQEKFEIQQENDNIKKNYCKKKHYKLLIYDYNQTAEEIIKSIKEEL